MIKFISALRLQESSASSHGANVAKKVLRETANQTQAMTGWRNFWLLFVVFALAALVRVDIASRSGLWADEVFSLAIATGHSLEQPAAAADPTLGDFVESDHPVRAEELQ